MKVQSHTSKVISQKSWLLSKMEIKSVIIEYVTGNMPNGERKYGSPFKGESPIRGERRVTKAAPLSQEGEKERFTQAMPPSELRRIERREAESRIPYLEEPGAEAGEALVVDIRDVERAKRQQDAARRSMEEAETKARQEKLKEKKETLLPKLWPDGINAPMRQGPVGDCYAVAALDRLKNFKNGEDLLLNMIDEVGEGKWRVRFYEAGGWDRKKNVFVPPGWVEIDISEKDLKGQPRSLWAGSLGERIIERAYFRFIHRKRGGEAGKTMAVELREIAGEVKPRISAEGGAPYRALHNFVGPEFEKIRATSQRDMKELLAHIAKDRSSGKNDMMALAATKERIVRGQPSFLGMVKEALKVVAKTAIYGNHAYAIEQVAVPNNTIVLVNPHDTSRTKAITFEDFFKYFSELYVVRPLPDAEVGKYRSSKTGVVSDMNR